MKSKLWRLHRINIMKDLSSGLDKGIMFRDFLLLLGLFHLVVGNQQSFIVAPSDVSVIQGQTAILRCQVANKKGALQWTKDGFALGFDRQIPGFRRYRMDGSESLGEYHLFIENVILDDDAEYQCQVGPAAGHQSLLGRATLAVIIPPQLPAIEGFTNGSVVKVSHNQASLNLTCVARDGKPAATLKWLRNGMELTDGVTVVYSVEEVEKKLENGQSVVTFIPTDDDNDAVFTCRATNPALTRAYDVNIQLSVLHAPGSPEITGYKTGAVVKTGDTVKLVCISRGGNPLAQVYWYRNGEELDFSYVSGNGKAENELIFTIKPTDNNAIYQCQASNQMTKEPLTAEVKLTVQFAPESVTITGHQNAKAGETITLKCESAISNPPAVISWFSRGRPVNGVTNRNVVSPKGGFITTSEIHVVVSDRENDVIYQCQGTNEALGQTVIDTITLKVMFPPGSPTIAGYTEGRSVYAGSVQTMTCTSIGGNPPATLKWNKGDKVMEGVPRLTGNIVSSQVSFLLKPDDNNAEYRCSATNAATVSPLVASVRLKVSFPPKSLNITLNPKVVKVGQDLVITCRSSSSNPASRLSWWKNGEEVEGIDDGVVDAEHGGKTAVSRMEVRPSVGDHGAIYACRATNVLLEQAVSDAVTLNVLYEPYFPADVVAKVDVLEGGWSLINMTASGNPSDIVYTWYFKGQKLIPGRFKRDLTVERFKKSDGLFNLTEVVRTDAGDYTCEARNDEGSVRKIVSVNVLFAAEITSISADLMVNEADDAILECKVNANPLDVKDVVTWSRHGFDMTRATTEYSAGTSTLRILSAVKDDSGEFICTASNGIGQPVSGKATLLVKYAPIIDRSPTYSKAAADKGSAAVLVCKATGVPEVDFTWFKGDVKLNLPDVNVNIHYTIEETKHIFHVNHESRLTIHNTSSADYGRYTCHARNELGDDSSSVSLDGTSKPDRPYDLRFVNSTHNSITLSWKPGFDGGVLQHFQVAYKTTEGDGMKYEDVVPHGSNVYTIKDLKLGTEYEITIKAKNRLGDSEFQETVLRSRTSAVAPVTDDILENDMNLIIILTVCIVGLVLLVFNIILILFFIRRRRKKMEKDVSDSASQANTLELFNNTPQDDSNKSYTTFEHRSIDEFPEDFKSPFDVTDDGSRLYGPPGDPYHPTRYYNYGLNGPLPPVIQGPYNSGYPRGYPSVGSGSREGLYPDEKNTQPWDDGYKGPHANGSFPHDGASHDRGMEPDDYTEQLRKMQKNLTPSTHNPRNSSHFPSSALPFADNWRPPSSHAHQSAIDNVDDGPQEFPRYAPPPESMYPSLSKGKGHQPPPTPPELRGHLV